MAWQLRALQCYAIGTTALLGVVSLTAFRQATRPSSSSMHLDTLTVSRINEGTSNTYYRLKGGPDVPQSAAKTLDMSRKYFTTFMTIG